MKPLALALIVVSLTTSLTTAQVEHAPTVAQCQADQRLWFAQVQGDAETIGGGDTLPANYTTLSQWRREMYDCGADAENRRKYTDTDRELAVIMKMRLADFIRRQQLWDKFLEEDAAGQR